MTVSDEANAAPAPRYRVVHVETQIEHLVQDVWDKVGPFDALGSLFGVPCRYLSGDGSIGTVRIVFDEVVEPLVARGPYSYTYSQLQGPMSAYDYHGTLGCEDVDTLSTRAYCTIVYNETAMDAEKSDQEAARIQKMFRNMLARLKAVIEG